MQTMRWMLCLVVALLFSAVAPASGQQQKQPIMVGHIDHVEGQLLRYVPENKDWVATVKDAPFGMEDTLYADENTRAEIIMPNNAMLRIGGNAQAQLLRMEEDVTEIDVASGTARFYNNSSNNIIRVTTPFGSVVAPARTSFDLYVGDESAEVIGLQGKVEFVHPAGTTKYEVIAGSSSIVANRSQVASGEGMTDASWNGWNTERDRIWEQRLAPRGETVRYLPEQLKTEAYALEEQGSWESVNYDGGQRQFWRPTQVSPGWAPYTCGRWTTWYGDQVWIPAEPFGYVTHHYGSWVYVDASRCWYWAPPVVAVGVAAVPSYTISYGWYPGRVSWIYTETYVGWVPLAPYEPYYCHNYWGPSVIVSINFGDDHHGRHDNNHGRYDDRHGRHHYEDHAVVVNQNNFYTVNNYNNVRINNIDRATIAKSYRGSPMVNDLVLKNHKNALGKYNFADINVRQKPHQTVRERIQQNLAAAKRGDRQNASAIAQKLDRMQPGKPVDGSLMKGRPLQVSDKLVPDRDVNKPKAFTPFATRELKPSGQVRPQQHEAKEPLREKPSFDADRGRPERKGLDGDQKPDQGSEKPRLPEAGKDRPERPVFNKPEGSKPQPLREDERTRPEKPERFQKPDVQNDARPARPERPVFNKPEETRTQPLRENDRTRPEKPERYQRPEPTRPQIDRNEQPAQPQRYERPARPEPRVEQPRTIQQPRQATPEPRQQPTVSRPETHAPAQTRTEQPRQVEPPVRHEQPVQQPRTIQQPRQTTPEPRQQPRQVEPTVRHEQPVQQPRTIQQPRAVTPEPRQQTAPQQNRTQSRTPTTIPQGTHR